MIFLQRIKNLVDKIKNNSIIILHSGSEIIKSEDEYYDFYVNKNFFYLTNIRQNDCFLLIIKVKDNEFYKYISIDKTDIKKEKWFGKMLNEEDIMNTTCFNKSEILYNDYIIKNIEFFLKKYKIENIYLDFKNNSKTKDLINSNNIENIYDKIIDLRRIKDDYEIKNIKEAINITNIGLNKIKELKDNASYEYELYNAFNHEILNHGTHEIGFKSIISSGINTCCLHYSNHYNKIDKENNILLCDVGARFNNYSADITRTYFINNTPNTLQSTIYNIVLECNKYIINNIKPGINLKYLQNLTIDFFKENCKKECLIKDITELDEYYFHNVSHHLGLDTHDPIDREVILEPNNIITCEPGLYFEKYKIGVRIEDDILVTKDSCINLSKIISKDLKS